MKDTDKIALFLTLKDWNTICLREPPSFEKDRLQDELHSVIDGIETTEGERNGQ